jgi:hypothetical protein
MRLVGVARTVPIKLLANIRIVFIVDVLIIASCRLFDTSECQLKFWKPQSTRELRTICGTEDK